MKPLNFLLILFLLSFSSADEYHKKSSNSPSLHANTLESSQEFWNRKAQMSLKSKLNIKIIKKRAKNVIMFLGDGMCFSTVAATRMYLGSEQTQLSFEKFPHFGLSKTYCVDKEVADSACTATAYLNGIKGNYRTLGVNANVKLSQCKIHESDYTESIASWALKSCKATGLVTTTRVTHASPSGLYAHSSSRYFEHNKEIVDMCGYDEENLKDIGYQLIHNKVSKNLKVILGGGRRIFINSTVLDEEGRPGSRSDGKNLINEWLKERNKVGKAEFVWHKQQLDELDIEKTDFLMGLFESDHCMYNLDILNNNLENQEPSLTDMTVAAIKMLQKEENGFFLFVEGGRIDSAHHANKAQKALEEAKEFSKAIDIARKMTSEDDTLIVVTSDHSHVFTYSGSANRGSDILGFAEKSDMDGMPLMTLTYANGEGYCKNISGRCDLTNVDFHNPDFMSPACFPRYEDTHGGDDVGVYSSGPWSHLFSGSYEQNNIPVLMAYAAQIGPYKNDNPTCGSSFVRPSFVTILTLLSFLSVVCRMLPT